MQLKVDTIRTALKLMNPVIDTKNKTAICQNILVRDGKLFGTNLEQGIIISIPEATDTCLLPYAQVSKLLETIPANLNLTIEVVKEKNIRLSWEGGKSAYPTADPRDFPDIERYDAPAIIGEVDGTALIKGMAPLVPYAAEEKGKPVLHGIHLYLGDKVTAVAADGFRLVVQPIETSIGKEGTIIIPLETVNLLSFLWDKAPAVVPLKTTFMDQILSKRMLTMAIGEKNAWAGFKFGNIKVLSQLIQGTPPAYEQLIPKPAAKIQVMAPNLLRAVIRTKDIASKASNIVRLKWDSNNMEVYATASEFGEICTDVPVDAQDGPGKIGISFKYLVEYLNKKDNIVTLGYTNHESVMAFEYPGAPLTLMMPMFVQWSTE